jgi:hypothetical protein
MKSISQAILNYPTPATNRQRKRSRGRFLHEC